VPAYVALSAIWGASFLFIKVADRALGPNEVALGRVSIGAIALCVLLAARRERLPRSPRVWGHLAFVALTGNAVPFTLFALGEKHVSSVLAGLWNATTPLMTLLITLVVLRAERPTRQRTSGLLLGFVGVIVLLGPWTGLSGGALDGDIACGVAALMYGVMITYMRRFVSPLGLSPVSTAAAQLICASAELALTLPVAAHTPGHLTASIVLSMVALGALGTGLAFVLSHRLIARAGATTASTVTYVMPLWSTTLGLAVLGEYLHWYEPVGAAIVLVGVAKSQQLRQALRGVRDRRRDVREPVASGEALAQRSSG
jgi:drug/metabolite transporter (DMT)-like permease